MQDKVDPNVLNFVFRSKIMDVILKNVHEYASDLYSIR